MGDDIYSGAAEYGKFMSTVGLILASIISVFLIIYGLKLLFGPNIYSENTKASISKSTCTNSTDSNGNITYSWFPQQYHFSHLDSDTLT